MRPMKDPSATGGGFGRTNPGPLSSNPDAATCESQIHSSATQSLYTDEGKEDEEMHRTRVIQSERQVFELAREYFDLNEKGGAP
jgi:hypothetical protein